jgi:acetyl esterase
MLETKTNTLVLEPATQSFIDALEAQAGPPIYTLSVETARQVLEDAQSDAGFVQTLRLEELTLPSGVRVTIARPSNASGAIPGIVYLHGGGWILGSWRTHQRLVSELAHAAQAAVIFVHFSPSPESQFPVPAEQAYDVLQYFSVNGAAHHQIDGRKLAIAGDSAGGNMAAVVSLLALQRKAPLPASQILFYPVTDASMSTGSYREFAEGPWLTKNAMEWFWDAYAPASSTDRETMEVSPVRAPLQLLSGMPETLVITAECDVLRDEGEEFARRLTAAGVKTVAVRYLATIHDFLMLNSLKDTPASLHATQLAGGFLHRTLHP